MKRYFSWSIIFTLVFALLIMGGCSFSIPGLLTVDYPIGSVLGGGSYDGDSGGSGGGSGGISLGPSGNSNFSELNGRWSPTGSGNFAGGGAVITFSGASGYMATVGSGTLWESARNQGHIRAGQEVIRYIAPTGSNTWSCEMYCLNWSGSMAQNNLTAVGYQWRGGTITYNTANGNLRIRANSTYDSTFRK